MHLPIVCFDLDGTLLDSRTRIHPNDVVLLESPNPPACLIPSTGRPLESVRRVFARNNLFAGQPIPFNMVLLNGSVLLAGHEHMLAYYPFDEAVQKGLIALSARLRHITFWFLSSTDIFARWPNPFSDELSRGFDFSMRPLSHANGSSQFSKIMCVSESPSALQELAQAIVPLPVEAALSMATVLEITPRQVDKGSGVRELFQHLQIAGQPFYAAGDGENDLPLFRLAARSFAPAAAPASIRAAASQIIDVSRDGLLAPILASIAP